MAVQENGRASSREWTLRDLQQKYQSTTGTSRVLHRRKVRKAQSTVELPALVPDSSLPTLSPAVASAEKATQQSDRSTLKPVWRLPEIAHVISRKTRAAFEAKMCDSKQKDHSNIPGHDVVDTESLDGTKGFHCSCGFGSKSQVNPETFVTHLARARYENMCKEQSKGVKQSSSGASSTSATPATGTAPGATATSVTGGCTA